MTSDAARCHDDEMGERVSVLPLDHPGPWHFDELADLPDDDHRYEVVDGNLVVTPPPTQLHQFVSNRIADQLRRSCPGGWDVFVEFALPLGTDGRVPDVAVVRADAPITSQAPYPAGPEFFGLVVEVVSARTRKTDRFAKPGEYAEAGIPFFWRVELDPELRVHAFALQDGTYVEGPPLTPWGPVDVQL